MKRPQSAKPGHKGFWGQSSVEDISEHPNPQKHQNRKQVKLMRPDLTTHDFARILPKKIQQDKERLYSEALQLKQSLNEVAEENMRLKTKVSILEREKEKMNKFIDTAPEGMGPKGSRINIYQSRSYEKDNMIVRNLKKIVKEAREDNDALRAENQKIKKMMKYTKINEFEIERKMLTDENRRLGTMLEDYRSHFSDQQEMERENEELKKYLEEELEEKQQAAEEREKYEEIIDSLEEKIASENDKYQNKQKRLLRDLNVEKRRTQELQRRNEQLARELKSTRESQQQYADQSKKNSVKPIIRTNHNVKSAVIHKVNTQQSQANAESEKKYNEIRQRNDQLEKELSAVKEKLKKAESQITLFEDKQKSNGNVNRSNVNVSMLEVNDILTTKVDSAKKEEPKREEPPNHEDEQEYEEQFENETKAKDQEEKYESYKKDFEENYEEEQLYKKDEPAGKSQNNTEKLDKKKEKKVNSKTEAFKPNKKKLAEIKELLTYRMKSQRYPFSDIKSDIESAETNTFTYADLCNMFVNEPFYLTSDYTKEFLSYCFEREKIEAADKITNVILVTKLRKVIDDFELLEENEEKEMIIRIAEMTSTYPRELQVAFENIKNGEETVGRKDLIEMFQKLELEDKFIDLIIAELSLCSDDLEHLNFHGFFERFYIEEENEDYIDNAIEEQGEESEQSYKHSSRVKKQSLKAQSKIEEEDES